MAITDEERNLMRNALGLRMADKPYRNRFFVGPQTPTALIWCGLVTRGLAAKTDAYGTMAQACFGVTDRGMREIGVDPERDCDNLDDDERFH